MPRVNSVCMLLIAVTLASCAGRHALSPSRDQVKVEVASVGFDQQTGIHYVLLEDPASRRALPILIGDEEARAILFELHGVKPPRPLTSDLLRTIIQSTGNHVDRVVIGDLRDQVYYAKIYLNNERYRIDSRPSDAIALAMGVKAPIYVASRLFESTGRGVPTLRGETPQTAYGLGITVEELTPELAQYFTIAPHSGVLVADVDDEPARQGLRRGDIVTQVEKRPVRSPPEFMRAVDEVKNMPRVTLTVRRGDADQAITIKPTAAAAGAKR